MSEISDAFMAKARESLAGASNELINGRYNNAANRAYYSVFQAAVVALDLAGVRPKGAHGQWPHRFGRAEFPRLLNQRKLYPAVLRATLSQLLTLRQQADYEVNGISETQAARALRHAHVFVTTIIGEGEARI